MGKRRFKRGIVLVATIGALTYLGFLVFNKWRAPCFRCNVILISIDTFRADELPCLGYPLPTAPNLCAYAGKGALFTRAYANSSWTLPVDISLFTGLQLYSHNVGITMRDTLTPAIPTLPEVFQRQGYYTLFVSNAQPNVAPSIGFGRGFDEIHHKDVDAEPLTPWFTALETIRAKNKRGKPVFAFFHTDEVHNFKENAADGPFTPLDPAYTPPDIQTEFSFNEDVRLTIIDHLVFNENQKAGSAETDQYARWKNRLKLANTSDQVERIFRELPADDQRKIRSRVLMSALDTPEPKNIAFKRHLYDTTIRRFDGRLQKFFDRVEDMNLTNRTVILIYSEHGEFFGEHQLEGHGKALYEEELRVPLIVRAPSLKPKSIDNLVQLIDIYPTLLDIAGIPIPTHTGAVSFAGILYGRKDARENIHIVAQHESDEFVIRTDRWKLFVHARDRQAYYELYDMHADPHERNDVSRDNPDIVRGLSRTLDTYLGKLPVYEPIMHPFPDWIDEEHRKNLIETGYFF